VQGDALKFILNHPGGFEIVFAAPPYPLDLQPLFQKIAGSGVAKAGGLYIFQHPSQLELEIKLMGKALEPDRRAYGSNVLSLYHLEERPVS
jgi:16S rRNA G966 N2-methylase RsmD